MLDQNDIFGALFITFALLPISPASVFEYKPCYGYRPSLQEHPLSNIVHVQSEPKDKHEHQHHRPELLTFVLPQIKFDRQHTSDISHFPLTFTKHAVLTLPLRPERRNPVFNTMYDSFYLKTFAVYCILYMSLPCIKYFTIVYEMAATIQYILIGGELKMDLKDNVSEKI